MTPLDRRLHHAIVESIIANGPRDAHALAEQLAVSFDEVAASLDRLAEAHALVLHPGTLEVWIAHPFSCSPTATWVAVGDRGWWALCMWCAPGIAALVGGDPTIHARLGGEAQAVAITAASQLVVHFARPPRDAWSNVIHYCATVLPLLHRGRCIDQLVRATIACRAGRRAGRAGRPPRSAMVRRASRSRTG